MIYFGGKSNGIHFQKMLGFVLFCKGILILKLQIIFKKHFNHVCYDFAHFKVSDHEIFMLVSYSVSEMFKGYGVSDIWY